MEYAAVSPTWKPRLVYYMYFTAMEPCYTYRESKTRHYWSNWLPIYSVSWVSLDYQDTGLELILLKVLILMQVISDMRGLNIFFSYPSMFLLLLVFLLLTLIISSQYFLYPFIVSKNIFPYIITANSYVAQVSRLILNLLEASCPLDESIDHKTMETLRFRHSESNRDTEADILQSDRGTTIMGEKYMKRQDDG